MKRNKRTIIEDYILPNRKLYIGIDNGVSGTIGWSNGSDIFGQVKIPCFSEKNYTKAKGNITRVNHEKLKELLNLINKQCALAIIERPMVNPGRFQATISAVRALESVQIALMALSIPYQFVDSKEWQKDMLPKGLKGEELKKASRDIGKRLFPSIEGKPDCDGILMAEWSRRKRL